jgi:hydroxymethylpyrimidine/phosphomethylpyrimidine kinase
MTTPVALSIAGSDPSGGAGIQADLKTFHQFGVYGEAVVTLITVQNSLGVWRVHLLEAELIEAQIRAVFDDIPPSAVKIGTLGTHQAGTHRAGNRSVAEAVARVAEEFHFPLVVDPVMTSKHGMKLGDVDSVLPLLPHAFLLTPNLEEASALCNFVVDDLDSMRRAAQTLHRASGALNVVVKGGHLRGEAIDVLYTSAGEFHEFESPRIETRHTHGTGCAFSAAITAELAKGTELVQAVRIAKAFVTEAIRSNPGLGRGSGPLNFFAR